MGVAPSHSCINAGECVNLYIQKWMPTQIHNLQQYTDQIGKEPEQISWNFLTLNMSKSPNDTIIKDIKYICLYSGNILWQFTGKRRKLTWHIW